MHVKSKDLILKELASIVGEKNATAAKHICYAYSYDMSFVKPKMPDYVVMATTVEQIQGILKFANKEKIPVIPYTAGTNIGGLCIPERGGIVLAIPARFRNMLSRAFRQSGGGMPKRPRELERDSDPTG